MISIMDGWTGVLANPSENVKHYYDILIAVLFFFVAQLLICAWDQPFWSAGLEFPGQIVAMVLVWLTVLAVQLLFYESGQGLDKFYHRYLRAPTEILNKHMSIGFTVPFLNLIGHSVANTDQIGLITAAFVVTGVLNSILVYVAAYHVQLAATKMVRCLRRSPVPDVEAAPAQADAAGLEPPRHMGSRPGALRQGGILADSQRGCISGEDGRWQRSKKHISDTSTLCTASGDMNEMYGSTPASRVDTRGLGQVQNDHCQPGDSQPPFHDEHRALNTNAERAAPRPSPSSRVAAVVHTWLSHNILLIASLLVFLVVGLPVSFLVQNDICTDTSFLFTVWLTFSSAQLWTKQLVRQGHHHRKSLAAAATLVNPVLWTSLFLVCYGLAKSSIRSQSTTAVIAEFSRKNTISDLIANHINSRPNMASDEARPGPIPIGAGDVATSILNAGIVSWSLKLFEYRHQIVSSGGLTVVVTSLLASLLNVVAWPLMAHAFGVSPASWSLSFAARSVTIALGGPAMRSLGGDAGINAVGVVVNGICFQLVAGFFAPGYDLTTAAGRLRNVVVHDGWTGLVWNDRVDEEHELNSLAPARDRGEAPREFHVDREPQSDHDREMRYSSDATHIGDQRPEDQNDIATWGLTGAAVKNMDNGTGTNVDDVRKRNNVDEAQKNEDITRNPSSVVPTVAAGVTIGINAAAMGTAHLYEQNSHAAPYSALSMTMFGVFTVLFTIRGPMTEWLVRAVSGQETEAAMML